MSWREAFKAALWTAALSLLLGVPIAAYAGASFRDPDTYRDVTPTAAQIAACAPDAARLCAHAIPDRDAVKFCMIRNKKRVSAQCREAFQ